MKAVFRVSPQTVLLAFGVFLICVLGLNGKCHATQRYSQYIDPDTGVVRAPEGFATGDDCWRTAWFYASLLVIQSNDGELYERLADSHNVDISGLKKFLEYFRDNCLTDDGWRRPTTLKGDFSRDQLAPLLYLLTCTQKYGPEDCQPPAKDIVRHLVNQVKEHGSVSRTSAGVVQGNLRYVIDVVSDKYDVDYVGGNLRSIYKLQFGTALKADSLLVQLPSEELATMDDYSVFNALALVTLQGLTWGKDDPDVKVWRTHFRQHADKGWGPAFKIVSGRSINDTEINEYEQAHIKRSQDNDIILGQRPHKYLSGEFPLPQLMQGGGENEFLVLDFVVLKALLLAWK